MARQKKGTPKLSEQAYFQIKDMIVSLQLEPGAYVDDDDLSETLNMGRTPVREANLRLCSEGLMEDIPGKGYLVKPVNLFELRDLFEALIIGERAAAILAARRISNELMAEIEAVNRRMIAAMDRGDYMETTRANSHFHQLIYQAGGNVYLVRHLSSIQVLTMRLAYLCFSRESGGHRLKAHYKKVETHHQKIIELLHERNGPALAILLTEHVKLFNQRVLQQTQFIEDELGPALPDDEDLNLK